MKRVGNLYDSMISVERMNRVFAGVMKDKKYKSIPGSMSFMIMQNAEYYKAETARILQERAFKPKKPRESIRFDAGSNKERYIQAPVIFPDQFVHWSLVLALEDVFMRGMDKWCCASVKGRGTLYVKNFLEKELDNSLNDVKKPRDRPENKYKYCLKMDIRKFFQNIDRDILMKKLESKVKDKEILHLAWQIIYSVPGQGLPLGYYTSQWFANFYLQAFDHYLREVLFPKYGVHIYVRYMDDMVILGSNKRKLQQLMAEIEVYLEHELHVHLKNTSCIFAIADRSIDFVGYRFYYGRTVLRKGILHSAKQANQRMYRGKFKIKNVRSAMAYNGWITHTDTKRYRDEFFEGTLYDDIKIMKRLANEERLNYLSSKEFEKMVSIKENIAKLREETELGDGRVLIRYYPNTEAVKVVARSRFVYPDQEEYDAKQRKLENDRLIAKQNKAKKKKKKHKHKKDDLYRASAERYFSENDMKETYARDYNIDMADYELYKERQNTKTDWAKTK